MRVPRENRVRREQREILGAQSLQTPSVLLAASKHEKGTAEKTVSSFASNLSNLNEKKKN